MSDRHDDLSIDDILADVREQALRYEPQTETKKKTPSMDEIDLMLGLEGSVSEFTDYSSAKGEEFIYVPKDFTAPQEEPVEAESFDDPHVSKMYEGEGVFDDYVREVRRKKERVIEIEEVTPEKEPIFPEREEDIPMATAADESHINPFEGSVQPPVEQKNRFMQALRDELAKEDQAKAPQIVFPAEQELHEEIQRVAEEKTIKMPAIGDKAKAAAQKPDDDEEGIDGQITLSGFDFKDEPERVDEKQVEQELGEKRKERAKDFKLYDFAQKYEPELPGQYDEEEDEDEPGENENGDVKSRSAEYRHFSEREEIMRLLTGRRRGALLTSLALGAITVVLTVLSVMGNKDGTENVDLFYAVAVLLLSIAAAVSISPIIDGIKAVFKLKPDCNTAGALAVIFAVAHAIAAFAVPDSAGFSGVYCAAAAFALTLSQLSRLCSAATAVANFTFCSDTCADSLYSIKNFDSQHDNIEIGRNLLLGDPELRYSCKTRFPSGFMKYSKSLTSSDRMCKIIIPIGLVAGIIMAVAGWIKSGAALGALTGFTGAMCVTMPAGAALGITLPMLIASKKLTAHGAMIASPDSAAACGHTNAVVVDSVDLYNRAQCNVFGFKDYKTVRIDDVFLYAAAMVISSGGPLSEAFVKIIGNRDILPPVKSLTYEDKLGLSALINGQRVLLGNRNILINHSIDAPPKASELKYTDSGKRVLYMTIENKIAIMFVVGYMENDELAPYLHSIHRDGINILVGVTDCNITEEFINEGFGLVSGGVKVMNPDSGAIYKANRMREKNSAPASVMHDGRTESFLRCIAAAVSINNISHISALIQVIGSVIGALVMFILLLVLGVSGIGFITAMIFIAVLSVVSTVTGVVQCIKNI